MDLFLRKAFLYGLGVIVAPQYAAISKDVLANMQVLALQLARVNQHVGSTRMATSWVAQTALWQLKLVSKNNKDDNTSKSESDADEEKKEQQRLALLPRLAENLASKCVGDPVPGELVSARREVYLLSLRALEYQSKWREMLDLLQSDVFKASDDTGVSIAPKQQIVEKQAMCMENLEMFKGAKLLFEDLLKDYPDNFSFWKGHLRCSLAEHPGDEGGDLSTEEFVNRVVEESKNDKYPKRAPYLMVVALATDQIHRSSAKGESVSPEMIDRAIRTIMEYGEMFGSKVSCAFTDLEEHLNTTLQHCSDDQVTSVLKWLQVLRVSPDSEDATERRCQQRMYIFSVKMTHIILAKRGDLMEVWLPDWKELVHTWKQTHTTDEPMQVGRLGFYLYIILGVVLLLTVSPPPPPNRRRAFPATT